jgi:hypothetical protein
VTICSDVLGLNAPSRKLRECRTARSNACRDRAFPHRDPRTVGARAGVGDDRSCNRHRDPLERFATGIRLKVARTTRQPFVDRLVRDASVGRMHPGGAAIGWADQSVAVDVAHAVIISSLLRVRLGGPALAMSIRAAACPAALSCQPSPAAANVPVSGGTRLTATWT